MSFPTRLIPGLLRGICLCRVLQGPRGRGRLGRDEVSPVAGQLPLAVAAEPGCVIRHDALHAAGRLADDLWPKAARHRQRPELGLGPEDVGRQRLCVRQLQTRERPLSAQRTITDSGLQLHAAGRHPSMDLEPHAQPESACASNGCTGVPLSDSFAGHHLQDLIHEPARAPHSGADQAPALRALSCPVILHRLPELRQLLPH